MDLTTIRKNIDIGVTRSTAEFQRDIMLVFTNAIMYNSDGHDVHLRARHMYQDVMMQIEVSGVVEEERREGGIEVSVVAASRGQWRTQL